jgi:hypothetical protein
VLAVASRRPERTDVDQITHSAGQGVSTRE